KTFAQVSGEKGGLPRRASRGTPELDHGCHDPEPAAPDPARDAPGGGAFPRSAGAGAGAGDRGAARGAGPVVAAARAIGRDRVTKQPLPRRDPPAPRSNARPAVRGAERPASAVAAGAFAALAAVQRGDPGDEPA